MEVLEDVQKEHEKEVKKPGAQSGHPHHPRKSMKSFLFLLNSDATHSLLNQECMVHIERYLRDSIENEKSLTWSKSMLELIQEMIHENNTAVAEGIADEKIAKFEARYDAIVKTVAKEYEENPPSNYYRDGYNLYLRMVEYKHNHLLFLSNPFVEPDNNLCERKARILKGKIN